MNYLFGSSHSKTDPQSFHLARRRAYDQDRNAKMHFPVVAPPLPEEEMLDGFFEHSCAFFEMHLPALRERLRVAVLHRKPDVIHVDIGKDLSSLYLAYYAIVDARGRHPVEVTMLAPLRLGADYAWSKAHPMLRRHLALAVLSGAQTVFVTEQETASLLWSAFPRLDREFVGAPISTPRETTAEPAPLPSPAEA